MIARVSYAEKTQEPSMEHTSARTSKIFKQEKDIGSHYDRISSGKFSSLVSMESEKGQALDSIHQIHGSNQVSRGKLAFAPSWLLEEAFKKEHDTNWADAYEWVSEYDVPRRANVITSHVVYKLKTDETGNRELKARIVPHGTYDTERNEICKEASTAQRFVIRLLLSLVTFLGFRLGIIDIKGAYLQSGPIKRAIYVRPPREWGGPRGRL